MILVKREAGLDVVANDELISLYAIAVIRDDDERAKELEVEMLKRMESGECKT